MWPLEADDPRAVGAYRLIARAGLGGSSVVYLGRSPGGRAVAVKVMHRRFAADAGYRARFRHEVVIGRAAAGRYSPAVLDADPDAARPWLAMEFLVSVSLRDVVRRHGPFPTDAAWALAAGLAEALAALHDTGIAHLDLTPANVLLTGDGLRLVDFGVARAPALPPCAIDTPPTDARGPIAHANTDHADTDTGATAGTWRFMAPEQLVGGAVGPPSDVFAFGATLAYTCLGPESFRARLAEMSDDQLRAMVETCLSSDPTARPSAAALRGLLGANCRSQSSGMGWLSPPVRAELARRASAVANPPAARPSVAPPARVPRPRAGRISRRALLRVGVILAVAGGAAGVVPLLLGRAAPRTGGSSGTETSPETDASPETDLVRGTATPPPATPTIPASHHTLEFYVYGRTQVRSLTTTVNGRPVTVRAPRLPYRRTVEIPLGTAQISWRVSYHCTAGTFRCVVSVDGVRRDNVNETSQIPEMKGTGQGVIELGPLPDAGG